MTLYVVVAIAVFLIGVWAGLGAPGWPHPPEEGRRHSTRRPLNPLARRRTGRASRPSPRKPGERRFGRRD